MTQSQHLDAFGRPIGPPVPGWSRRAAPPRTAMIGRYCRVEPLDLERHVGQLHAAFSEDRDGRMWSYLAYGPFPELADYVAAVKARWQGDDPLAYAVIDGRTGKAAGQASYIRINAAAGNIEVGGILYAPSLQRSRAATEAMVLMIRRAFEELGYRRYAWQCNALNAASRNAATRLGFTLEGIFRQAEVFKGLNRDTAWFSILDREWPSLKLAFERWLDPGNFDAAGRQRVALSSLTKKEPD